MKFKSIAAACMAFAVLFTSTAFAAQPAKDEKIVLTYDKAVELATKNNTKLSTLEDSIDYMEKNQEITVESMGSTAAMMSDPETRTMTMQMGNLLTSAQTLETNIQTSKYNKDLIKIGNEYLVKNYFNGIKLAESGLELAKKNASIAQDKYNQDIVKSRLGMVSKNDLQTSKSAFDTSRNTVEQTELAIEKTYDSMKTALGIDTSKEVEIDYEISYEPYELGRSIESYITTSISKAPSIKIAEANLDLAKRLKNISTYETAVYSYLEKENNVSSASRNVKDAKDNMKTNITNAYNDIKTLETERESLETALKDAKTTYETAKTNYAVGNVTSLTLKQAELGVENAENNLVTNAYNHDLKVFAFNNPSILGSSN